MPLYIRKGKRTLEPRGRSFWIDAKRREKLMATNFALQTKEETQFPGWTREADPKKPHEKESIKRKEGETQRP